MGNETKHHTPMQELIEKIDNEIKHYEQYGNYESDAIIKGLLYARNHANDCLEKEKRVIMDVANEQNKTMCRLANTLLGYELLTPVETAGETYFNKTFNTTKPDFKP